ncbi:DUF3426 domain-containing protein [Maricurvus nonylphenolicus]|uniref:DUF3426 domain-containing protein n=1 Tax=Maricurvus nonylphenolicus TaxID=1008307 RepID=UPI0036F2C613
MADRVTRCPKCSTSFRITDAQLQLAKGAVRCGSCLSIFKALDHLVETTPQPETQPAPAKEEPAAQDEAQSAENTVDDNRLSFDQSQIDGDDLDDEDILISDDMDKKIDNTQADITLGGELSESFLDFDTPPQTASLFEREAQAAKEEDKDHTDESWAVDLLNDLDEEPDTPPPPPADDLEDTLDDQTAFAAEDDPDFDYSRKTTGTFQALDDQTLEDALGEPLSARPEPRFSLAPSEADEELQEFEEELEDQGYQLNQEMLENISLDVVELEQAPQANAWPKRLLWGSLSLVASLLLVGQVGYAKFDHLSRVEPYRSHYATACELIGCQLPTLTDRSRIKTHNLLIRSHPKVDSALVIDAIILNSAPFDQSFPALTLTFSDINNKVVASRRFTPNEYLGGELAGRTIMPQGQPVHLSLEIVDPGSDAINYRLESTD